MFVANALPPFMTSNPEIISGCFYLQERGGENPRLQTAQICFRTPNFSVILSTECSYTRQSHHIYERPVNYQTIKVCPVNFQHI